MACETLTTPLQLSMGLSELITQLPELIKQAVAVNPLAGYGAILRRCFWRTCFHRSRRS